MCVRGIEYKAGDFIEIGPGSKVVQILKIYHQRRHLSQITDQAYLPIVKMKCGEFLRDTEVRVRYNVEAPPQCGNLEYIHIDSEPIDVLPSQIKMKTSIASVALLHGEGPTQRYCRYSYSPSTSLYSVYAMEEEDYTLSQIRAGTALPIAEI